MSFRVTQRPQQAAPAPHVPGEHGGGPEEDSAAPLDPPLEDEEELEDAPPEDPPLLDDDDELEDAPPEDPPVDDAPNDVPAAPLVAAAELPSPDVAPPLLLDDDELDDPEDELPPPVDPLLLEPPASSPQSAARHPTSAPVWISRKQPVAPETIPITTALRSMRMRPFLAGLRPARPPHPAPTRRRDAAAPKHPRRAPRNPLREARRVYRDACHRPP
ncbi:MAG: hypothetical protein HY904_04180 [Deltaproteobacteria bacterium]|nr:hypothetical protein [Deltaproteobacteria bacterium]